MTTPIFSNTTATTPEAALNDKWALWLTPFFVISYPKLDKPELSDTTHEWNYVINALFKLGEDLSWHRKAVFQAAVREFGPDKTAWPELKTPFYDQAKKQFKLVAGKKIEQPGFTAGALMASFKFKASKDGVITGKKPLLTNIKNEVIHNPLVEFYGGAICRAQVRYWGYSIPKKGAYGVKAEFTCLQKLKDGTPLGRAQMTPEQAFPPVEGLDDDFVNGQTETVDEL